MSLVEQSTLQQTWQRELATAIRTRADLLQFVGLSERPTTSSEDSSPDGNSGVDRIDGDSPDSPGASHDAFPLFVSRAFANRIAKGDWQDPLLLQVLATQSEHQLSEGFVDDPVGDQNSTQSPGVIQKYDGRALLLATGSCAIHCRYCFRKNYPYSDSPKSLDQWSAALRLLEQSTSIREVIFSGGDPWMLPDERLSQLTNAVDSIGHVETLRFHTRMPIVLPSRVNSRLVRLLAQSQSNLVVVVHTNHANEIDEDVRRALRDLREAGALLLNQSVLLAGVNDSTEALSDLSRQLLSAGVLPYYLHQLDRVSGTAHFEVPEERGLELIDAMRNSLPGYLVPKYVREQAGESSKTPLPQAL
jgi:EF-P beta-lysylation protein EpmB